MKDELGRMIEDALRAVTEEATYAYPDRSMPHLILTRVREAYVTGYMQRWAEEMKAKQKERRTVLPELEDMHGKWEK